MTIRELLSFLNDIPDHRRDGPVLVEGQHDQWEVMAAAMACGQPGAGETMPLTLMSGYIELPTVPRARPNIVGYHPDWFGVLGQFQARIRLAPRPQILSLMDRMSGRPPGWEVMDTAALRTACLVQAGAWMTRQAVAGDG